MFLPTYRSRHQFPIMFQPASAINSRPTHTVHAMSFACTPRTVSPSDDRAPLSSRSHYIRSETTVRQQSRRLLLWAALHRRSMRPFATYLTRSGMYVSFNFFYVLDAPVSLAETDEPIEMSFGGQTYSMWAPKNHVGLHMAPLGEYD